MASPPARLPDSPLGEPGTHVDHLASRTRRASVVLPSEATGKNETHRDASKGLPYVGRKRGLVSSLFWPCRRQFCPLLYESNPFWTESSFRPVILSPTLSGGAWLGVVARSDCTREITEKEFWKPGGWESSRRVIAGDVWSLDLACNRLRIGR